MSSSGPDNCSQPQDDYIRGLYAELAERFHLGEKQPAKQVSEQVEEQIAEQPEEQTVTHPAQERRSSLYENALNALNAYKSSERGIQELLRDKYEREHRAALLEQSYTRGFSEGKEHRDTETAWSFMLGCKRQGYTLERALILSETLLTIVPRSIREEVAKRVFDDVPWWEIAE